MCNSNHDLLKIVQHKMRHISGGADLAKLCVDFHAFMKHLVDLNQISFIDGFTLSARSVLRICDSICSRLKQNATLNPLSLTIDTLYKFHTATVSISDKDRIETELIARAKNFETKVSFNNLGNLRAKNTLSHFVTVVVNIFLVKLLKTLESKKDSEIFEFYWKIRQKLISFIIPDALSKEVVTIVEIKQEIKKILFTLENLQKGAKLKPIVIEFANMLHEYVTNASFINSRKRHAYLKQVFYHFHTWKNILFNMEEKFCKDSHFKELFKWFNYLNVRSKLLHWLKLPAHDNFVFLIGRIRKLATCNQFSGLAHHIDAGLSECIKTQCDVISLINLLESSIIDDLSQDDIDILNSGKIMIAAIKASWDYLLTVPKDIIFNSSIATFLPPIKLLEELRVLKAVIDCKSIENIFLSEEWNNQKPTILQEIRVTEKTTKSLKEKLKRDLKELKKDQTKAKFDKVQNKIINCKKTINNLKNRKQKIQEDQKNIKEKISVISSENSFKNLIKVSENTIITVHNKICGVLTNVSKGKASNFNFSLPFPEKFVTVWNDPLTEHFKQKKMGFFWFGMFFNRPPTVPLCSVAILCHDGHINSNIFDNNNPTVFFIREKNIEGWKIMIFTANNSPTLIEWDFGKCKAVQNIIDTYRNYFNINSKIQIKKVTPISQGKFQVNFLFEIFHQFDNSLNLGKSRKYFKELKLTRESLLEKSTLSISNNNYLYLTANFIDKVKQIQKEILSDKSLNFNIVEEYRVNLRLIKTSCEALYTSKMNFIEEIPPKTITGSILKIALNKPKYSKYDVLLSNFKSTIESSKVQEEFINLISNYYKTFWFLLKHIFNACTKNSELLNEILQYGLDCIVFLRNSNERIMSLDPLKVVNCVDQKIIERINNDLLDFCDKLGVINTDKHKIETLFNTEKYYHLLFERNITITADDPVKTNKNFSDIKDKIEKILKNNIQRIEYFQSKALFREELLQDLKVFHEKLEVLLQKWSNIENQTSLENEFNDIKKTDKLLERRYREYSENNEHDTYNLTATLDFPPVAFEGETINAQDKSFISSEILQNIQKTFFNPQKAEQQRVLLVKILEEQIKVQQWEKLISLCFQYYSEQDKIKKQIITDKIKIESEKTSIELQCSLKTSVENVSTVLLTYYIQQRTKLLESNKFDYFGSYQIVKRVSGAHFKDINMIEYYHVFEELSKTITHIKSYSEAAITLEPLTFCFSDILILWNPFSLAKDIGYIVQLEETLNTKLRDHNIGQINVENPIEFKPSNNFTGGIFGMENDYQKILPSEKDIQKISNLLSQKIIEWLKITLFNFSFQSWIGSLKDIIPLQISIILVSQSMIAYCFSSDILNNDVRNYNKVKELKTILVAILKEQEGLFSCICKDFFNFSVAFDESDYSNFVTKIEATGKIILNCISRDFFILNDYDAKLQVICKKILDFTQKIESVEKNLNNTHSFYPFISKCTTLLKSTNISLKNFCMHLPNYVKAINLTDNKKVYHDIYHLQYTVKDVEEMFSKFSEPNITIEEREEIIQNLIPKVFDVLNAIDVSKIPKKIHELIGNISEFLIGAVLVCIKYFRNNWECKHKAVELKKLLSSNCKDPNLLKFNKWKECTIDRNILFPSIINSLNRLSTCIMHDYIPNISFILINLDKELNTLSKSQIRLSYISEQLCNYFFFISFDNTLTRDDEYKNNFKNILENFLSLTKLSTPDYCLQICTSNETELFTSLWDEFYGTIQNNPKLIKQLKLVNEWTQQFTLEIMKVAFQYKVHCLKYNTESYDTISLLSLISKVGSKKLYNKYAHIENSIKFFHKALQYTLSDVPAKISNFKKIQPNYPQKPLFNLFTLDDKKIGKNCLELQEYSQNPTTLLYYIFEQWYSCQFYHLEYKQHDNKKLYSLQSEVLKDLQSHLIQLNNEMNPPLLVRLGYHSSSKKNPSFEKEVLDALKIAHSCGLQNYFEQIKSAYTKNFGKIDYKANFDNSKNYGAISEFKILPNYQISPNYTFGPTFTEISKQEYRLRWDNYSNQLFYYMHESCQLTVQMMDIESKIVKTFGIRITPEILVKSFYEDKPCENEFSFITCTLSSGPKLFIPKSNKIPTEEETNKIDDIIKALESKPSRQTKKNLEEQMKQVNTLYDIVNSAPENLKQQIDKICKLIDPQYSKITNGVFEKYCISLVEKFCGNLLKEAIKENKRKTLDPLLELINYHQQANIVSPDSKGNLISSYQIISQKLKLLSFIQEGQSSYFKEDSINESEDIVSLTKAMGKLFSKQPVFVVINSQLASLEINFGHNSFDSTNPRKTIYVKNGTKKTVSIQWKIPNQNIFTSNSFLNDYSIPPEVELPMVISLNTNQKGTHVQAGVLSVTDSNNEEKHYNVKLRGIVEVPEIRINKRKIIFTPTPTGGKPNEKEFEIQNKSDCLVPINIDCPDSFSILNHDTEFQLTAKAKKIIKVSTKQCHENKHINEILKINYGKNQKNISIKARFIKPDFTVFHSKNQKILNNSSKSCTPNVPVQIYVQNNCDLNLNFKISASSSNNSWKCSQNEFTVPKKNKTMIELSGNFSTYYHGNINPTIYINCVELPGESLKFYLIKKSDIPRKSLKISEPYEFNNALCCVANIINRS